MKKVCIWLLNFHLEIKSKLKDFWCCFSFFTVIFSVIFQKKVAVRGVTEKRKEHRFIFVAGTGTNLFKHLNVLANRPRCSQCEGSYYDGSGNLISETDPSHFKWCKENPPMPKSCPDISYTHCYAYQKYIPDGDNEGWWQ